MSKFSLEEAINTTEIAINTCFNLGRQKLGVNAAVVQDTTGDMFEVAAPPQAENITELIGTYAGRATEDNTVVINVGDDIILLRIFPGTIISSSVTDSPDNSIKEGDQICSYALHIKDELYGCVALIKEEERTIFDSVKSIYGRANIIKLFYDELNKEQRKIIIGLQDGECFNDIEMSGVFNRALHEKIFYALIVKKLYPISTQRVFLQSLLDNNDTKHKGSLKRRYIMEFPINGISIPHINMEEMQIFLDEKITGLAKAKQQIISILAANQWADKRGINILIISNHGMGVSHFLSVICEYLGLKLETISMDGIEVMDLVGSNSTYESSNIGRTLLAMDNKSAICFDNIAGASRDGRDGDALWSFSNIIKGGFDDRFLGSGVDTSKGIFFSVLNALDEIPYSLREEFDTIIRIDDFTLDEKLEIARKHIIPLRLKEFHVQKSIDIPDKTVIKALEFSSDAGTKDLDKNIVRIIRHTISKGLGREKLTITPTQVDELLNSLVDKTPELQIRRNKHPHDVLESLERNLAQRKRLLKDGKDITEVDKKVSYLMACKTVDRSYDDCFDPEELENRLNESLFGMSKVMSQIVGFFNSSRLGTTNKMFLALYGSYGVGKTSIAKCLADTLQYTFFKISLSGVSSIDSIRGSAYNPGLIAEAIKRAGSYNNLVLLFDEIDKARGDVANCLIDVLDGDFYDNYLGVHIPCKDIIIIATANIWQDVPKVLRDRFFNIKIDGYTREDKLSVLSQYIIPKIQKEYEEIGLKLNMTEEDMRYLLRYYCSSFGIRDVEKTMISLIQQKLLDYKHNISRKGFTITLDKDDIEKNLGSKPFERGNIIDIPTPGVAMALAVQGSEGSIFAIETYIEDENDKETLTITGLPQESMQDSVKVAITNIKRIMPGSLKKKAIHIHMAEGAVPKDGPSAGGAIFLSILSALIQRPIMKTRPNDISITAELGLSGGTYAIGGLKEKLQAACDHGCHTVFISKDNYEESKDDLSQFNCEIIPVSHINEVISGVFPDLEICFGHIKEDTHEYAR